MPRCGLGSHPPRRGGPLLPRVPGVAVGIYVLAMVSCFPQNVGPLKGSTEVDLAQARRRKCLLPCVTEPYSDN